MYLLNSRVTFCRFCALPSSPSAGGRYMMTPTQLNTCLGSSLQAGDIRAVLRAVHLLHASNIGEGGGSERGQARVGIGEAGVLLKAVTIMKIRTDM